jgi:hypothetical protein
VDDDEAMTSGGGRKRGGGVVVGDATAVATQWGFPSLQRL